MEAYFIEYGIHVTIFTDDDLAEPDGVFKVIARYLKPENRGQQLLLQSRNQLLQMDLDAEISDDDDKADQA
jgi:hypothetical protein